MGNSFVFFDVSIVISHGQFHCGNRGHTKNTDFPWVKSHFPVGKRSSGTAAIVSRLTMRRGNGVKRKLIAPVPPSIKKLSEGFVQTFLSKRGGKQPS